MKVRVCFTIDIDDDSRRVISNYYGREGLASREQVRSWFTSYGEEEGSVRISDILYYESTEGVV